MLSSPMPPKKTTVSYKPTILFCCLALPIFTNTIAEAQLAIRGDAAQPANSVGFQRAAEESYQGMLDYVALIATNNFFVQIQGSGNAGAKSVAGRVYGYRARADASTYAALVQSEVLSA